MQINDIKEASKLNGDLEKWKDSLYNLRRLIIANNNTKQKEKLSRSDYNIFGKIRLLFKSENGKHKLICGQPPMDNISSGCSEEFSIDAEQLEMLYEVLEKIKNQKESKLLKLLNGEN